MKPRPCGSETVSRWWLSCVWRWISTQFTVRSRAMKTAIYVYSNPEQNAVCHIQAMQVVSYFTT